MAEGIVENIAMNGVDQATFKGLRPGDELRCAFDHHGCIDWYPKEPPSEQMKEARYSFLEMISEGGCYAVICFVHYYLETISNAMIACGWNYEIVPSHLIDSEGGRVELNDPRLEPLQDGTTDHDSNFSYWQLVYVVQQRRGCTPSGE